MTKPELHDRLNGIFVLLPELDLQQIGADSQG
jgi:hypothetical protein